MTWVRHWAGAFAKQGSEAEYYAYSFTKNHLNSTSKTTGIDSLFSANVYNKKDTLIAKKKYNL
jgi:hypothetical protein